MTYVERKLGEVYASLVVGQSRVEAVIRQVIEDCARECEDGGSIGSFYATRIRSLATPSPTGEGAWDAVQHLERVKTEAASPTLAAINRHSEALRPKLNPEDADYPRATGLCRVYDEECPTPFLCSAGTCRQVAPTPATPPDGARCATCGSNDMYRGVCQTCAEAPPPDRGTPTPAAVRNETPCASCGLLPDAPAHFVRCPRCNPPTKTGTP